MVSAGMPNLRRVAWGVLATIALIGVWSNASLERDTGRLLAEISVMNITDRQRVYAEEVARHAWQLVTALSHEDRQQARARLKRSVAGMRDGHGAWVQATALNDPQDTAVPLFVRLDVEVQGYLAAANSILLTPDGQLKRRNSDVRWLEHQATGSLISVLDEAIAKLEDDGDEHIRRMNADAKVRLLCVIVLLVVLGQGVFRPLDRRIRRVQGDLITERDFAQQVMTTAAQGLTVTDAQGRFEYVNPAYAQMVGLHPDALLGRTPFDVAFADEHLILREAAERCAAGETSTYEAQLRRTDSTAVPVLITETPRVIGGVRTGAIASITDLTEQKLNEQTVWTLAALSHGLEQEQTPEGVARRALSLLSQSMDLGWLTLYRRDGERFVLQKTSGDLPSGAAAHTDLTLERNEGPIWETLGGRAVYLTEARLPPFAALGPRSVAVVPLPAGDGPVTQVLCAARSGEARPWVLRERVLLETAARSVAAALQRAELHQEAQNAASFAQTLLTISALVESEFDPSATAAEVLNLLGPALQMNRASVLLVRDDQAEVVTAWPPQASSWNDWDVPKGEPWLESAAAPDQTVTILDSPATEDAQQCSVAWVSLATAQDTQFLMVGARPQPARSWSQQDRALLGAAARTVRVAWERQGRFRQVELASLTDPLTGLGNRRALNRSMEDLSLRSAEPFGLLSIDVDGLKVVNDTFGHDCGDLLLQEFARALKECFRGHDLVFRLGGDEFVVLLPGCRQEQAQSMLNRVQAASDRVRRLPELVGCGASVGAAFCPDDGQLLPQLITRADERMYEHKRRRKKQLI
ncbi:diguanylate cyclase (plasmid) [Deinococcus taeanensis]|uniref:sensor domain-containing diguanylate cyclase n=1 Tax=Deinococcus taeanensis TaxID=2737050 RepID=UPI001CDD5DD5|nr:diguanylate cyclase [Deinococcus taeanensis]UBV44924.1 diguanylate cyclase [Deinococcus taeanensis]